MGGWNLKGRTQQKNQKETELVCFSGCADYIVTLEKSVRFKSIL